MKRSESTAKIAAALAMAQAKFGTVKKNHSAVYDTRAGPMDYDFADIAAYYAAVRRPLARNGIALLVPTRTQISRGQDEKNAYAVGSAFATVRLEHESGEFMESDEYEIAIADAFDGRSCGSASTYAAKNALKNFLGIAAEEDDDAEAARGGNFEQHRAPTRPEPPQRPARQQPERQPAPHARPQRAEATVQPGQETRDVDKARLLARDGRDVQIRRDLLGTGVAEDGYKAFVEKIIGRALPNDAGWHRALSDADRDALEAEAYERKDQGLRAAPDEPPAKDPHNASGNKRDAMCAAIPGDIPARTMTVVDAVEGTTRTITTSPRTP